MSSLHRPLTHSINFVSETILPTEAGPLNVRAYRSKNGTEPLAIYKNLNVDDTVLVRIHDACFTSEVLGSTKCDCKAQLDFALEHVRQHGGLIIYLHQEGRGVGLANKIAAYALQEQGLDTVDANRALHLPDDARDYNDAAAILNDLGIKKVEILTNNPLKISALQELGVIVVRRLPIYCATTEEASSYLQDKIKRMGHLLPSSETD